MGDPMALRLLVRFVLLFGSFDMVVDGIVHDDEKK